ncbi:hypothetical protein EJ110_NYTH01984 [Nymphaea thermarum]|nr:hypothetical protein EJ110_NYTH01984 [Nymphaea thermarum]
MVVHLPLFLLEGEKDRQKKEKGEAGRRKASSIDARRVVSSASRCDGIAARPPPFSFLFVFVVLLMGVVHFHRSVSPSLSFLLFQLLVCIVEEFFSFGLGVY